MPKTFLMYSALDHMCILRFKNIKAVTVFKVIKVLNFNRAFSRGCRNMTGRPDMIPISHVIRTQTRHHVSIKVF